LCQLDRARDCSPLLQPVGRWMVRLKAAWAFLHSANLSRLIADRTRARTERQCAQGRLQGYLAGSVSAAQP